ncbi:hypothetical protein MTO96_010609 [Rhipicephalus appendiculatus]
MDTTAEARPDCPENEGQRRSSRCHVKGHLVRAVLGVAAVVSSVSGFRALKHGKWSNFSGSAASATAQRGFISQAQSESLANSRTFLCVASLTTSYAAQIPSNLCTYLVYTDVYFNPRADSFSPVNVATLSAFENASSSTGARVLAAVGSPSLPELAQSASLVRRVGEAATRWLVARGFRGLAFVNYRTTTDKLEELAAPLEELQNILSSHKLEIALSLSLGDWLSPNALISTRLYSIAQHLNLLVLQTHYYPEESKCKTGFPTVYSASREEPVTVPITSALGWINTLKEDFKVRASVCFSLSLGVLVFAGASTVPSECKGVRQRGYDTVCDGKRWEKILPSNPHGGASINRKNVELASYEDATIAAKKVSTAIQKTASACVAVFDVDMDDYEGVCGAPFARLRSLHRAISHDEAREELNRRDRRPLLCILSERTDRRRTVSREHCTHFVYSLRHMEYATALRVISSAVVEDFSGADVPLLVALDERALERVSSHELAQQTSALFHRYGMLGLALLYVTMPVTDAALLPALVILHTTYKQNNLCLLFSVQVLTDADDTSLIVPSIRQIARLTDMFVLNTHYPGFVGPCRVMAASTLHEERKTCIPTLPMDTAAEWLRQIEEENPQGPLLFLSVDMRAFRYRVYQRPALEASCNLEEHVEYSQVCNTTGWRELEVHATATAVAFKGNEVLSFETPESMKTAALTIRRASQRGSVAVFNADFEDWQGSCHGGPYARLSALRSALDSAEVDLPVTVEQGSVIGRPLVCVVSGEMYDNSQVPDRLCTHIVHPGLSVDLNTRTVFLSDHALRLAWSLKHSHHLAALAGGGSSALVANLEQSGPRTAAYVALQAAGFLRRHALHGLALLNLARTTTALVKFAHVFRAMRSVLHADLQILLSVEIVDTHVPPKLLAKRMNDLVKEVDILVFETHFYHSRGYCQMEPPSSFEAPKKAFTVSMRMAMSWMEALNQNNSVCLSVNMAVLQFTSTNDQPSCVRRSDVGYSEICDSRDWKITASNSSYSMSRRKETIWQFYEEPKLLRSKVSRVIARQPTACVAAFNIDYDDYKPVCGNTSFPRLAAIEEAYNQADGNVSDVRVLQNSPYNENAIKDIFRMTGYLNSRKRRPLGVKQNFSPPKPLSHSRSNESRPRPSHRPFVCVVSSSWSQLHALPRRHCTHYVFDPEDWHNTGATSALNVSDIKEYVGSRKKCFARVHPSFDEDEDAFARIVRRVTVNGFDGVAVVEQKFFSTELTALAIFVTLLKRRLPERSSIILGVDVQDYDEDPTVVLQRLSSLFSLSEVFILQTHFTRSWAFCKTAYPSLYADTGDGCSQSVPMKTALLWARSSTAQVPVCISVSMATHAFRVPILRPVGTSCATKKGSETLDDRYGAAYSYVNEEWLSYEAEHLLTMKMRAARRLHPSFCVAVFNVDYGAPGTQCSRKRAAPFVHLHAIADGAGYKKVVEDEKKAPDSKYVDVNDDREPPTLVCVVSDDKQEVTQLPEEGCDYLVYQSVIYKNNETFVPRSNNTEFFNRFASAKSHNEDTKYLVALDTGEFISHHTSVARNDQWFTRFVGQLVLFLEENSMDGVALVELPLTLADLDLLTPSLAAIRRYTAHFGYLYLLGVTLRGSASTSIATTLPRIAALSRLADVVVLESHLVADETSTSAAKNGSCTIHFPSSAHASALGGGLSMSLDEAGRILRRLERAALTKTEEEHGENEALLCFSVTLAAFRFRVDNNTKGLPGQACIGFDMVPFRETCMSSQHKNLSEEKVYESARSSYRVAPGAVFTFDSVKDIEHKLLSTVHGLTCGAVYAVNFDEAEPVCSALAGMKGFPRLQAVINSIAVASTAEEEDAGDSTTLSVAPTKERATHAANATGEEMTISTTTLKSATDGEKRLICTVANVTSEFLQSDGWKACSHLVFTSLSYDHNSSGLASKDGKYWLCHLLKESLNAFLALRNYTNAKLAVELDIGELLESQLNTEAEQVAVATLFWMHKHGLERLALFVRNPGYADTIIYITHHSVPSENCVVLFPSTFDANFTFSDVERSDLLPPGATDAVQTKRFCVSVSMAVLRFLVNEHIPSLANSTCFDESWVPYEQENRQRTYDAESMAILKQDDSYAFTFENEESLHLKAQRILDLLGAEACVAAFQVEYDAGRNACAPSKHSSSRLTELASALHDKEHKLTTSKPSTEGSTPPHREGRMGEASLHGGEIYALLLLFKTRKQQASTTDRVLPRDAGSFRDFVELSKRDVTSRLVGAFDDVGFAVPWASDHLFPGRFARSVASWCHDYALHGVAFLALNFSALQRAEPSIRALNNMSTVRQLIVLGIPRTDDPLILKSICSTRGRDRVHYPPHRSYQTVPSHLSIQPHDDDRQFHLLGKFIFDVYNYRQTAQLTNQLVRIHRHLAGVCVAANMAVLKFSLPPRHSDLDDSCIDEEQINYAQVCAWEGNVEYDTVSSAVLSRKHDNLLTYENEYSLETKARSYLSYTPLGCVAAFNADYEDPRGTCRPAFSRLTALDNALGKRNRPPATPPGESHRGTLVCVPSSTQRATVDFPFSQCDVFVDGEVEYLYNNVIKTSSYKANLQGRLLDAKLNWTCFVVSLDASKELSNEFSEQHPKPILILLVSAFEPESRLKELSMYPDFLVLTNEVPNESKDCKLHGTMTATTDEALKLSMSRLLELSDSLGSRGGVCFSTTLAVYRYRLHQGLHGAGESCRRMVETTFGEACPPEESDRLIEVSSLTSYTFNKSHLLAFEDQRSLRIKMETFLSRYPRGCVVAFGADMDTAASNCTGTKHFERLKTLRALLGRTEGREKTVEKDL